MHPVLPKAAVGLRPEHHEFFLEHRPPVPWLEVTPENYRQGVRRSILEILAQDYPLSCHGVGLSLGSDEKLSKEHLHFLKDFCDTFEPALVSEHISWASYGHVFFNDLLPLPYTEGALRLLVEHIQETQDFLGRQILVENPSSYMSFTTSTMTEQDFMMQVAQRSGCNILLDVNNVYVSARNHGFDPYAYVDTILAEKIGEIHLAGHQVVKAPNDQEILIDHHGDFVANPVWALYEHVVRTKGKIPTLIEWDNDLPAPQVLLDEAQKAQMILDNVRQDAA